MNRFGRLEQAKPSINKGSFTEVALAEMRGSLGAEFWGSEWEGVRAIQPDPVNPDWLYVAVFGANRGLYRSQSRGDSGSWQQLWTDDFMRSMAISPNDPSLIFATSVGTTYAGGYDAGVGGVLYSDDSGQSWPQMNQGLAWPFANEVAITPTNPNKLYIDSPGAGLYWRTLQPLSHNLFLPAIQNSPAQ